MILDTFLVYSFVFISLFVLSLFASARVVKTNSNNVTVPFYTWEILLMLLIFAFIFGIRYNVGVDYFNYKEYYFHPSSDDRMEFLFEFLTYTLRKMNVPVEGYFSLWAFLQLFFLLYAFKEKREILPFLIIAFICGQYFLLWMNVIRQDLATCIFIFSIRYIQEKKFWKYLFWIIIASGIHRPAIALLVIYPIFRLRKDYFRWIWLQFFLLFIASIVYLKEIHFFEDIDTLLALYLEDTSYEHYVQELEYFEQQTPKVYFGNLFLSNFIIDFFLILYSNSLRKYYQSNLLIIYYNLYFIGNILGLLLGQSILFLRPIRYFRFFELVVVAYLFYYLIQKSKNNIRYIISLFLLFLSYLYQYYHIFIVSKISMYTYHSTLF